MKKNGKMHVTSYDENETPNPCSFYKIMSPPTLDSKMLRLPESFTGTYGAELSSTCRLIVPTGVIHQVALVKENNELWFKDGWGEFTSHFSIGYGYFTTFTYEGNSDFRVKLFDLTACEISYHSDKDTGSSQSASPKDSSEEILEFGSEDEVMQSESSGKTNSDTFEESEGSQFGTDSGDHQKNASEMSKASRDSQNSKEIETDVPTWMMNHAKELKALKASEIPGPLNPFYVCSITRSSMGPCPHFRIPRGFAREHMKKYKSGGTVILKMSSGRQWEMIVRITHLNWNFGKGLVQFMREARLKVDDVLLFELVDAEKFVFKVRLVKPA